MIAPLTTGTNMRHKDDPRTIRKTELKSGRLSTILDTGDCIFFANDGNQYRIPFNVFGERDHDFIANVIERAVEFGFVKPV